MVPAGFRGGAYLDAVLSYEGEFEFLIRHGSRFRIVSRERGVLTLGVLPDVRQ